MRTRISALALGLFGSYVEVFAAGCSGDPGADGSSTDTTGTSEDDLRAANIANIANANVGHTACGTNSRGGRGYDTSCTGNGGEPEYWCADFARWVWGVSGAKTEGLTAGAGSFYLYGQEHHTLKSKPAVGDAVVYNYKGSGYADHVALVTRVLANGDIETMSGDWNGQSGSEAHFASTSHVVRNSPAYPGKIGDYSSEMGMHISAFVAPVAR